MEGELEMLRFASQTSSQVLAARCFLAATSLAVLLDLPLMGNTLSSQVKSNCEMIIPDAQLHIPGQERAGRYVIIQMDNGEEVLNLREVKAFGRVASITKMTGCTSQ